MDTEENLSHQRTPDYQTEKESDEGIVARLKSLLAGKTQQGEKILRAHVIVNPAAGKDQPILKTLNAAFRTAAMDWDLFITKKAGDGRRLAREAVQKKVDMVAVHGGDGTVMEVASGLIGSEVPMAIIPGGTANIMALELGIPFDLVEACALAVNPQAGRRKVDMGKVGEYNFMIRAGIGLEAAMVAGADREMKDRLGTLAYAFSALQALAEPQISRYHLTLDGMEVVDEGLTCIIANAGNVGRPGISMVPTIDVSDGFLDVVVIEKADLPSLVSMVASVFGGSENADAIKHWQVREVTVVADPPQSLQVDGEMLGQTPVTATIIPQAVQIIVPKRGELVEDVS